MQNKAVDMATPVAGSWAGAVVGWAGAVSWAGAVMIWAGAVKATRILKVDVGPTDRHSDTESRCPQQKRIFLHIKVQIKKYLCYKSHPIRILSNVLHLCLLENYTVII